MYQVCDSIFAGNLRSAQDLYELEPAGITHIVSIGQNLKPMFPKKFSYLTIEASENQNENIGRHFHKSTLFCHKAI